MATAPLRAPSAPNYSKLILWSIFALMGLSVFLFYDLPIFNPANPEHARMVANRLYLIPHALTAIPTILIGPIQFSSRFRRKYLNVHRLLGRIYVVCVMIAAPTSVGLAQYAPGILRFAGLTQAILWIALTYAAFLTARNGQIAQHRQWMVRSYGVGCTIFVLSRITNLIPALRVESPAQLSVNIMFFMLLAVVLPSFYFGWREITTRRPTTAKT
jgi:uncharacterized membrane protein